MEKHGLQHAWLGAMKTAGVNVTDLAGACLHTRGCRDLMYGDLKGQLELSHTDRRSIGWQQGVAGDKLEKKKRKRENGPLHWALVWAKKWSEKWVKLKGMSLG